MTNNTAFGAWMCSVDAFISETCGLTHADLADYLWRDAFDSGETPESAAREALEADGFPSDLLT